MNTPDFIMRGSIMSPIEGWALVVFTIAGAVAMCIVYTYTEMGWWK